jgi:hypothetical protein
MYKVVRLIGEKNAHLMRKAPNLVIQLWIHSQKSIWLPFLTMASISILIFASFLDNSYNMNARISKVYTVDA